MQEAVLYLSKNPEVFRKIEKGEASLLGVTTKELKAILDSFRKIILKSDLINNDLWR